MDDFDKRRVRDTIIAALVKTFPERWQEILAVFDAELARAGAELGDADNRISLLSARETAQGLLTQATLDENLPVLHVLEKLYKDGALEGIPHGEVTFGRGETAVQFAKAFDLLEEQGLKVEVVAMSPRNYSSLRKTARDVLDLETRAVFLKQGLMGTISGAQVLTSRGIPEDTILLIGPESGPYPGLGHVHQHATAVLKVSPLREMEPLFHPPASCYGLGTLPPPHNLERNDD